MRPGGNGRQIPKALMGASIGASAGVHQSLIDEVEYLMLDIWGSWGVVTYKACGHSIAFLCRCVGSGGPSN